jgi:hypothetical protein
VDTVPYDYLAADGCKIRLLPDMRDGGLALRAAGGRSIKSWAAPDSRRDPVLSFGCRRGMYGANPATSLK